MLLLHCCYTVVTLLLHGCYTVVTLLLHCCYTAVTSGLRGTIISCVLSRSGSAVFANLPIAVMVLEGSRYGVEG
jgi:hypothetical protein